MGDTDRAVLVIATAVEGCASSEEALTYFWEARARLTLRLQVMRRHTRAPGMAAYVERLVADIDEAITAAYWPATPVPLEEGLLGDRAATPDVGGARSAAGASRLSGRT